METGLNETNCIENFNELVEKLNLVLTKHYSIHEADAIERDILDSSIAVWEFKEKFNTGEYEKG